MTPKSWGYSLKGVQIEAPIFFSKLADFWYSGVFGHEKSIGASPEFQKKFYDPLSGVVVKTCNMFSLFVETCYMIAHFVDLGLNNNFCDGV